MAAQTGGIRFWKKKKRRRNECLPPHIWWFLGPNLKMNGISGGAKGIRF
jgi:hypothetical protein